MMAGFGIDWGMLVRADQEGSRKEEDSKSRGSDLGYGRRFPHEKPSYWRSLTLSTKRSNLTGLETIFMEMPIMRNPRFRNRLLNSLLVLAIFASSLVMAFHHHTVEAKAADHCSVCLVGHQVRTGGNTAVFRMDFGLRLLTEAAPEFQAPVLSLSRHSLGKLSQAPPTFA